MPTPIPISPETAVVQSGTSIDVGQQRDQSSGGDPEADQGDGQGQDGRHYRSEGDQQHDRRAEETGPLGAALRFSAIDRVAAELDLEAVALIGLGGVDQLRALVLGHVPARDRERQGRCADLPALGVADLRVRGEVLDLLGLGEECVHAPLDGWAPGPCRIPPGDVDLLGGVAAEALLSDVARRLGVGAGRVVAGVVIALQGAADADDQDRGADPGEHHQAATAIRDVCKTG